MRRDFVRWGLTGCLAASALAFGACGSGDDAPAETPDSGVADGSATDDGGLEDTGSPPPRDAGPDVPKADGGKSYCSALSPAPKFCDDFDDADLDDDWAFLTTLGATAAELDATESTSAPTSFHVQTPAHVAGGQSNVHLRQTATGTPTHVQLAFSTKLPATNITQGVVAIATLDVAANHFFTLYLRDGDPTTPGPSLEETSINGTTRHPLTALPTAGMWTRVVIDLDLAAAKASVSFGATKALDAATIVQTPIVDPTFRIGAVYVYGPSAAFEGWFDDVVVDF